MNSKLDQWLKQGLVLLDGAWGTELQKRGLPIGACPDAWNLEKPELVEAVARSYVEAGSQVILSNTFGANRWVLAGHGLEKRVAEINKRGVEASVRAAKGRALVFASLGPSGKLLADEEVTEEELEEGFAEQAKAMAEAGADGICVETMSDVNEALAAVRAAKSTGLMVSACMVYDSGAQKNRTMMGVSPAKQVEILGAAGADILGANCGLGIELYVNVGRELRATTQKPVWIKANAGLPEMVNGRTVYRMSPETFAGFLPAMKEAGVSLIGGCCGTSPEFIRALAKALGRA